jgi:hypothetical protein
MRTHFYRPITDLETINFKLNHKLKSLLGRIKLGNLDVIINIDLNSGHYNLIIEGHIEDELAVEALGIKSNFFENLKDEEDIYEVITKAEQLDSSLTKVRIESKIEFDYFMKNRLADYLAESGEL